MFHSMRIVYAHGESAPPFSSIEEKQEIRMWTKSYDRRSFIGGSDARLIMGNDQSALVRLWQEKRGEIGPEDLSGNLIVQLGSTTEDLNRSWYERNTGRRVTDIQRHVKHSAIPWMAATLDGIVEQTAAVFEAKFMLPWSFSEEAAAEKYMAQLHAAPHRGDPHRRHERVELVGGVCGTVPQHAGAVSRP
jgi:predicted phage-related endonuclease